MVYTLKMSYFLEDVGILVLHVAVSQVNSERSGKLAQNERRSFHGTSIIALSFQMRVMFIVCSYSKHEMITLFARKLKLPPSESKHLLSKT